MISAKKYQH